MLLGPIPTWPRLTAPATCPLPELIHARLEDILGQPLIQRIQKVVRGAGSAGVAPGTTAGHSPARTPPKGMRTGVAGKPPKAGRRAPWNEEWSSPNAATAAAAAAGPMSTRGPHSNAAGRTGAFDGGRGAPAGGAAGTPPKVARAQSARGDAASPLLVRTQSASPTRLQQQRQQGQPQGQGYGQDGGGDPYYEGTGVGRSPGAAYDSPGTPSGPRGASAQLSPVAGGGAGGGGGGARAVLVSPGRPASVAGSRYSAAASGHGSDGGSGDDALSRSDAAVIAALNPEAAATAAQQQQRYAGYGAGTPSSASGRPPSARATPPTGATRSPRVVTDPTMMSLSNLSLAASPAGRAPRTAGALPVMGVQRSQLGVVGASSVGAMTPGRQQGTAAVGGAGGSGWSEEGRRGQQGAAGQNRGDAGAGSVEEGGSEEGEEDDVYEDDFEHVDEVELQRVEEQGR